MGGPAGKLSRLPSPSLPPSSMNANVGASNSELELTGACVRCGHRDRLVKCVQCPVMYCSQTEQGDDTACLTLNPEAAGDFRCVTCHGRFHGKDGAPWPSPRMRFQIKHVDPCPDKAHINCVGLAVTIVFERGGQSTAEAFAQLLRGRWESNGWPLHLTFWERGVQTAGRAIRTRKADTSESSSHHNGAYCRTLVIFIALANSALCNEADKSGIMRLIEDTSEHFPIKMVKDHKHGLYLFVQTYVPLTNSFALRFQEAVEKDSCLFGRVAVYATLDGGTSISAAFTPAIASIKACWGKNMQFRASAVECCQIDRRAQNIAVLTGEKQKPASITVRHNFALFGWTTNVPLEHCKCTGTSSPNEADKRWEFMGVNRPGQPTVVTLRCSHCRGMQAIPKPENVRSLSYHAGAWYWTFEPSSEEPRPSKKPLRPGNKGKRGSA
ncbi:hypothetical protein FRC08_006879 [Ceratobasidium sp. 394]|nr:hypothetical protein FRC08_006879 [Ceratobasidium sp. 394]